MSNANHKANSGINEDLLEMYIRPEPEVNEEDYSSHTVDSSNGMQDEELECIPKTPMEGEATIVLMIGFKEVSLLPYNIWGALNKKAKRHLMDIMKFSPTFLIIMETHGAFEKTLLYWK